MKKSLLIFIPLAITAILLIFSKITFCPKTPKCVKNLMKTEAMKNADFSMILKDIDSGKTIYDYNTHNNMVPASVLKIITTATALEILGADYRYQTILQYDGEIKDNILYGNIYIKGNGDPTLGSKYFESSTQFLNDWQDAIKKLGINKITGSVISDEIIFDDQGIHPKWITEDIGNYYAAGSYGIDIFDNEYTLHVKTNNVGTKPVIESTTPEIMLEVDNHLVISNNAIDTSEAYIFGIPFSNERYIRGGLPPNSSCVLKGDIPDPPLYLANLFTNHLKKSAVSVEGAPTCNRLLAKSGKMLPQKRKDIIITYSATLGEIIKVTNHQSHNLFADALLKTIGSSCPEATNDKISSFEKGIKVLKNYWQKKGIDTSTAIIFDGSGLAIPTRVITLFICKILEFMAIKSTFSETFINSLPKAGIIDNTGNLNNFLSSTHLQGKANLKSGSMDKVRCYAGYIENNSKLYAICLFSNNYNCSGNEMNKFIEKVLLNLF